MENRRQAHHANQLQTSKLQTKQRLAVSVAQSAVTATTAIRVAPNTAPSPYAAPLVNHWVRGKNLDFCLLAVCSCVLAVLCHQAVHLPSSQAVTTSTSATSSRVMPSQLDFMIKAGLFTSSNQRSEGEEEIAE